VPIPGNPLRSFDISFSNPDRYEYCFADRSNNGLDIIDTGSNSFKRRLPGFVGFAIVPGSITPANPHGTVNNNKSGPDGVATHGRWVYAGDGDSTLKVFDLDAPATNALKQSVPTGGANRVDEMALTSDGRRLLAANNAEDPPFATLFVGDDPVNHVSIIICITIADAILPVGHGLSIEQSAWEPKTKRFYVSVPTIADNPPRCNIDAGECSGGMLVVDPRHPTAVAGLFDEASNTGVVKLD
jgi:hypothetical protein